MWDEAKAVLKREMHSTECICGKDKRSKINNLSIYFHKPDKEQIKSKVSKRTGKTKIIPEINAAANRKSIENEKKLMKLINF